ncbi:MAG TPA: SIS domain-containing protein [Acidimicrobiales bacterium]|nr:SIS domain-containing protein [Acidimicrobiales bacterium]
MAEIRAAVVDRPPKFVVIAARGTSDNAALYAQYLFAVRNGIITALATPSTITLYGARPQMAEALVIGISQSGASPDIVAVIEEARRQGALTIALTNAPESALAQAAAITVDLQAGPERAIAATKTYTTELLAVALLSTALKPATAQESADICSVPEWVAEALSVEPVAQTLASGHAQRDHSIVLARGFAYATAREWALKLQELAQVSAFPFSAADFEHGPLALAEPGLPVLVVAPAGPPLDAQRHLLERLKADLGARLLVVSNDDEALRIDEGLPIPRGVSPWLSPLVEIIPAQLYTYYLTIARGLDPEAPRTITKVTETH